LVQLARGWVTVDLDVTGRDHGTERSGERERGGETERRRDGETGRGREGERAEGSRLT
jgi:hypothetical protein